MEKSQKKMNFGYFTRFALLIALSGLLSITSCTKDEKTSNVTAPPIRNFGVTAVDTTITLGGKIEFTPVTDQTLPIVHSWNVNGKEEATTQNFTFQPKETGRYKIIYSATNDGGTNSKAVEVIVRLYKNGFYIVNEGWFGHDAGSVNFFDTDKKELVETIYKTNNTGLELGTTTCYGAIWKDVFYFISKQGRRLVAADAFSLKDKGELVELGGDGRAFAGIDETKGVVTTSNGAYIVNLNPLSLGAKLDKTEDTQCGGVYATKTHIFVISSDAGIIAYNAKTYTVAKEYGKGSVGFALAKDGSLWAANETILLKIDTKTLEMTEVALPEGITIYSSWGSWRPSCLVASKTENALFFPKANSRGSGKEVYRYVIGNAASMTNAFIQSTVEDDNFYGSGIAVDPATGDIIATFTKNGWGDSFSDNRLVIFDGKTGLEKARFHSDYYWFPSMILFN